MPNVVHIGAKVLLTLKMMPKSFSVSGTTHLENKGICSGLSTRTTRACSVAHLGKKGICSQTDVS